MLFHTYRLTNGMSRWRRGVVRSRGDRKIRRYGLRNLWRCQRRIEAAGDLADLRTHVMEWRRGLQQDNAANDVAALRKARHEAWGWGMAAVLEAARTHCLTYAMYRWKYVFARRALKASEERSCEAGGKAICTFFEREERLAVVWTLSCWRLYRREAQALRATAEARCSDGIRILYRLLFTHRALGVARTLFHWESLIKERKISEKRAATVKAVADATLMGASAVMLPLLRRVPVTAAVMRFGIHQWRLSALATLSLQRESMGRIWAGIKAINAMDRAIALSALHRWLAMWRMIATRGTLYDRAEEYTASIKSTKKQAGHWIVEGKEAVWRLQGLRWWKSEIIRRRHEKRIKTMGVRGVALALLTAAQELYDATMQFAWQRWQGMMQEATVRDLTGGAAEYLARAQQREASLRKEIEEQDSVFVAKEAVIRSTDVDCRKRKGIALLWQAARRKLNDRIVRNLGRWRRYSIAALRQEAACRQGAALGWGHLYGLDSKETAMRKDMAFIRWQKMVHEERVGRLQTEAREEKAEVAKDKTYLTVVANFRLHQMSRQAKAFAVWVDSIITNRSDKRIRGFCARAATGALRVLVSLWRRRGLIRAMERWIQLMSDPKIRKAEAFHKVQMVSFGGKMVLHIFRQQKMVNAKACFAGWRCVVLRRPTLLEGITQLSTLIWSGRIKSMGRVMKGWKEECLLTSQVNARILYAAKLSLFLQARMATTVKRNLVQRWIHKSVREGGTEGLAKALVAHRLSDTRAMALLLWQGMSLQLRALMSSYFGLWGRLTRENAGTRWRRRAMAHTLAREVLRKRSQNIQELTGRAWQMWHSAVHDATKKRGGALAALLVQQGNLRALLPVVLSWWGSAMRRDRIETARRRRKGYSVTQVYFLRQILAHAQVLALVSLAPVVHSWREKAALRRLGTAAQTQWLVSVAILFRKRTYHRLVAQWYGNTRVAQVAAERDITREQACGKGLVMMRRIVHVNLFRNKILMWGGWKAVACMAGHVKKVLLKTLLLGSVAGRMQRGHASVITSFVKWKAVREDRLRKERVANRHLLERDLEAGKARLRSLCGERIRDYAALLQDLSRLQGWVHDSLVQASRDQIAIFGKMAQVGTSTVETAGGVQFEHAREALIISLDRGREAFREKIARLEGSLQEAHTEEEEPEDPERGFMAAETAMRVQRQCGEGLLKQLSEEVSTFQGYMNRAERLIQDAWGASEKAHGRELESLRGRHREEISTVEKDLQSQAEERWGRLQAGLLTVQGDLAEQEMVSRHTTGELQSEVQRLRQELDGTRADKELLELRLATEQSHYEVEISKQQGQVEDAEEEALGRLKGVHQREEAVLAELTSLQEEVRLMRHKEESVEREKEGLTMLLTRLRDGVREVQQRHGTRSQDIQNLAQLERRCSEASSRVGEAAVWIEGLL